MTSLASLLSGLYDFVGRYLARGCSQLWLHTLEQNLENESQKLLNLESTKVFSKS